MTIAAKQITDIRFTKSQSENEEGKVFTIKGLPRTNPSDIVAYVFFRNVAAKEIIGEVVNLSTDDYALSELFPANRDVTLTLLDTVTKSLTGRDGTTHNLISSGVLQDGAELVVSFTTDPNQLTAFREGSRTTPVDIENALDKNTMAIKSINKILKRSLKVGPQFDDSINSIGGEILGAVDINELQNHILVFDANGNLVLTHRDDFKGDEGEHAIFRERLYYRGDTPAVRDGPNGVLDAISKYNPIYNESTKEIISRTPPPPPLGVNQWFYTTFPPEQVAGSNIEVVEILVTFNRDQDGNLELTKSTAYGGPFTIGERGPVGPKGDKGDKGEKGDSGSLSDAERKSISDNTAAIGAFTDADATADNASTASLHARVNRERHERRTANRDERGQRSADILAIQKGTSTFSIPEDRSDATDIIPGSSYTGAADEGRGLDQINATLAAIIDRDPVDFRSNSAIKYLLQSDWSLREISAWIQALLSGGRDEYEGISRILFHNDRTGREAKGLSQILDVLFNIINEKDNPNEGVDNFVVPTGRSLEALGAAIAALKTQVDNLPSGGGGGGATEEQLDELRHLIQIAEAKIPEEYRVLKKPQYGTEDDTPHALGETINDLPEVAAIDPAEKADKIDFVVAEEAPDSSLTAQYQDIGDPVDITYMSGSFPTTADVRMFHSSPKTPTIQIGGRTVGFEGSPYILPSQGASFLQFTLPESLDGVFEFATDVEQRVLGIILSNTDIRASETAAGFRSRLDFVLDGNEVDAAMLVLIPSSNTNPGIIALAVASVAHSSFILYAGESSTIQLNRVNTANGRLTVDSANKQVSIYLGALTSGQWQAMFGTDRPTTYETGRFRLAADSNFAQASFNVYRQEFRHLGGFEAQKMTLPNVATTIGRTLAENAPVIASGATEIFATSKQDINAYVEVGGQIDITSQVSPNDLLGRALLQPSGARLGNASASRGYFALATRGVRTLNINGVDYILGGPSEFDATDTLDLEKTYDLLKHGDAFSELQIIKNGQPVEGVFVFTSRSNNRQGRFSFLANQDIGDALNVSLNKFQFRLTKAVSGYTLNKESAVAYAISSFNIGSNTRDILDLGTFPELRFGGTGSGATGVQYFIQNVKVSQHLAANQIVKVPTSSLAGATEASVDAKIAAHNTKSDAHSDIRTTLNAQTSTLSGVGRILGNTGGDPGFTGTVFERIAQARKTGGGGTITKSYREDYVFGSARPSSATALSGFSFTANQVQTLLNSSYFEFGFARNASDTTAEVYKGDTRLWVNNLSLGASQKRFFTPVMLYGATTPNIISLRFSGFSFQSLGDPAARQTLSFITHVLFIRCYTEIFTIS